MVDTCGLPQPGLVREAGGVCRHIGGRRMRNRKGGIPKEVPAQQSPMPTLQPTQVVCPQLHFRSLS